MAGDDEDKTVFGQPLPTPPRPGQGAGQQGAGGHPSPPPTSDKTAFGQPLPGAVPPPGSGGGRSAPVAPQPQPYPAQPQPINNPGADDTWLGGVLNPQPQMPSRTAQPPAQPAYPGQQQPAQPGYPAPQQPPAYHPQPQHAQPLYQPGTGQPQGNQIFPDIPAEQQPQQMQAQPRIAFQDALRGVDPGAGGSTNPLVRAASNLLILMGRLRTGLVDMQPAPLIDHVAREVDTFERNALAANVSPQDAQDAKFALCATADDIVQNLPGADKGVWYEYSMEARFFGSRTAGVGFFQTMDEAMRAPGQRFHLLELMLTCLSLGFEGQYRATQNGAVDLARIRMAIYETLRRVQPRPDDDVSVRWTPILLGGKRRRGATPLWVIGAIAATLVVALFATLSTLLTQQGAEVQSRIIALHQNLPALAIERTAPILKPFESPEPAQLERIRAALAPEIEAGQVEVDRNNTFIFVRVGDYLRFRSGSADLQSDFSELAARIGETLNKEFGQVRVVGHTDSIPPSGRGRYKTNESLSVARAQTVADILAGALSDPDRITVEGKGAVDPIADNGTREGRARNRRVEIMIPRED
jgi:type VI secretion system protein ImpK